MAVADNMPNDTPADMARRIKDLERAVRELSSARTLDRATITAAAGLGVRTADFDGTDFAHPGTVGNYFGGDGAVLNSLYLRPGSVANDALTDPVFPGVYHAEASDFTVSTTMTTKATATVSVPAGYTRAMVSAVASVSAFNPTATSDYIYVAAWIESDTTRGFAIPSTCPASQSASATQAASALLTGISGSFTIKAAVSSGFVAFTSSVTGNVCNIDATVLFLR